MGLERHNASQFIERHYGKWIPWGDGTEWAVGVTAVGFFPSCCPGTTNIDVVISGLFPAKPDD